MERFSLKRKVLLLLTLSVSLGILFIFKYFNFVSESFSQICRLLSIPIHSVTLKLILPVGISFYTFQTLSYVIDVYKGKVKAEHHFGKYAAFITFFPQLVAGPIERTENLLHQINEKHFFDYEQAAYGMKLMAWGFFKKLVIADNLAVFVDLIYGNVSSYQGFSLILATVFFSIQIYCDFSGYSDIAIGTARLFGIELMTNFRSPYFSGTVKEFWSRWHISLSTWFRDYIYIPLGGNRKGRIRQYTNLMITFFASGAWHGANWTFLMWGG
jgi:D-alanyl-lipoteichoic acid acyltransferase DltB (MBOAT superfamily)